MKEMKKVSPELQTHFWHKTWFKVQKKPAKDLPYPGIIFARIKRTLPDGNHKTCPVLIIELKSVAVLESDSEEKGDLPVKTFQLPEKV